MENIALKIEEAIALLEANGLQTTLTKHSTDQLREIAYKLRTFA